MEDGKTTPRSLRHLPHHDSSGKVDPVHLRNALSRLPQSQSLSAAQKAKAQSHLEAHAKSLGIGDYGGGKTLFSLADFNPAEMPFDEAWQDIVQIVNKGVEHAKSLHARRREDGREFGSRHTESLTQALTALEGASADMQRLLSAPEEVVATEAKAPPALTTPTTSTDMQQMKAAIWRKLERHKDLVL